MQDDITYQLITPTDIKRNLTSIFNDAIVVRENFVIAAVSKCILKITGFEEHELEHQPLNFLSASESLQTLLQRELSNGFSAKGVVTSMRTRNSGLITCEITGFYLGLISDLNGYIILRVRQIDEISLLNKQLESSRKELDEFIYRAAHDLRGPLATIRGLVNLMKLDPGAEETMKFVEMIDTHAIKMDDRLFGLHYLSQTGRAEQPTIGELNSNLLESSLRSTVEQNHAIDQIHFHFHSAKDSFKQVHDVLVTSMLNNILLYLLALPRTENNHIYISLRETIDGILVIINSRGFIASYQLMNAIRQKAALYSNAVTYSQLVHYYAAQKISFITESRLEITTIREDEQCFSIAIPYKHC